VKAIEKGELRIHLFYYEKLALNILIFYFNLL